MFELPDHLPMNYTEDGQGPADVEEAAYSACWCVDRDKCSIYPKGEVLNFDNK